MQRGQDGLHNGNRGSNTLCRPYSRHRWCASRQQRMRQNEMWLVFGSRLRSHSSLNTLMA